MLGLVCRVDSIDAGRIAACVEAGADAIELNGTATQATLEAVEQSVTVPWGFDLRGGAYTAWQEMVGQNATTTAEWITVTMADDARFLVRKGITSLLEVDVTTRPEMLRGVSSSGASGIIAVSQGTGAFTIEDIVRLRYVVEALKQPVLVAASVLQHQDGMAAILKDAGVVGVVLETSNPEDVRALAASLDESAEERAAS